MTSLVSTSFRKTYFFVVIFVAVAPLRLEDHRRAVEDDGETGAVAVVRVGPRPDEEIFFYKTSNLNKEVTRTEHY